MQTTAPKPIERHFGRRRLLTTAFAESDALHTFANDPAAFLKLYSSDVIKRDKTSTVLSTSFDGQRVVIKSFNRRNLIHPLKRALRRSRAEHCFNNALLLGHHHVPTPAPLAAVEERIGPLRGGGWFVTQWIDGIDLIEWFRRTPMPEPDHTVVEQIHSFFRFLGDRRIAHGDMKGTNLYVASDRLFVLDLDGMRQYQSELIHRDRLARDARRFMKNWRDQPAIAELFNQSLQPLLDAEPPQSRWFRQRLR